MAKTWLDEYSLLLDILAWLWLRKVNAHCEKKGNIWTTGAVNPNGKVWALSRYDQKSLYNKKPTVTEIICIANLKSFVNYEKNQFSNPNVPLAYSSHRTALF